MKKMPDIAVIGTDTGVGKTVVSLLLMQLLYSRGYAPFYLKPFQTGCSDPHDEQYSDAAFVYRHTEQLCRQDPSRSMVLCHPSAKAPFFAARDAGESVDLDKVYRKIDDIKMNHAPLVMEAAGGLMVPVTSRLAVVDVVARIGCRPLLVARPGLGTINHTLLSVEALKARDIDLLGVIFVEAAPGATDPVMVEENMEAIRQFSGIAVCGVMARVSDFSRPPKHAYLALERLLFS